MKGLKYMLLGLMLVLIGGFILASDSSSAGGFGEVLLFVLGICLGVKGLKTE